MTTRKRNAAGVGIDQYSGPRLFRNLDKRQEFATNFGVGISKVRGSLAEISRFFSDFYRVSVEAREALQMCHTDGKIAKEGSFYSSRSAQPSWGGVRKRRKHSNGKR